jgi:hypothetical protein
MSLCLLDGSGWIPNHGQGIVALSRVSIVSGGWEMSTGERGNVGFIRVLHGNLPPGV